MLVSIIIPYFNDPANIHRSIDFALKQSYLKTEIIIVNDENSRNSDKILNVLSQKSKKIKIIKTYVNRGVSFARNLGIKNSKGNLIAFLDSDDVWKKHKLRIQIKAIKNKNLDICYTNYLASDLNKNVIYKVKSPKKINYEDLIKACPICCSSVVAKSNILKKYKFSNLKTKEDYELWLRISKKNYTFGGIDRYLTEYTLRSNTLSSKYLNKISNAFKIYYIYNNYSLFHSMIYTCRLYFNAFIKKYF
ncbi:glycosyltransferase family 2 protein [Candidatus Pelagibacter bacterium nBUS_30]|uniref:glycosyltransferase family 2 protein n=1 Tax=Candidatus Pelagibacter bacterium nBUS_30 TaxID=3374191 RepID=UPI003EBC728C